MKFKRYQHIERLGSPAVEGILNGSCYIFPKLDGSNASVYLNDNGEIEIASRNRVLTPFKDNQGCRNAIINDARFKDYLEQHPTHRLFGEWLVPHTIRGYKASAWHKLYIFDVMDGDKYLDYFDYIDEIVRFGIDFIPPITCLENPTSEQISDLLDRCTWLMEDNSPGEGIIIKNYDFVNKFGDTIWAKLVRISVHPAQKIQTPIDANAIEPIIIDNFLTPDLIQKEFAKLAVDGWHNKLIGKFLQAVWFTFVTEETFNFVSKHHNPKVNFALLRKLAVEKIKSVKPELF